MEPESKKMRSSADDHFDHKVNVGDEVRIINLPAYPGLEGLTGTVVGLDDKSQTLDVELLKNKAIKRVCLHTQNIFVSSPFFLAKTRKSSQALHWSNCRASRSCVCIQTEWTGGPMFRV